MSNHPHRTLTPVEQSKIAVLANGSVLYDVKVTTEDGAEIDETFRTFVELELNKPQEFEVRPYDDARLGITTFTLIPREHESRTAKLVKDVEALTIRVNGLENELDARIATVVERKLDAARKEEAL